MAGKELCLPEKYSRRKLNSLYREVPLSDTHFRLLRKYFSAMANLYGIIPLWKAFEIIQEQNPGKFSEDELLAFAEIARHELEDYYILGAEEINPGAISSRPLEREIVDIFQMSTVAGSYEETRKLQGGKPYYIPSKKDLLQYNDIAWCEPTIEYRRFMGFLGSKIALDENKERIIFTNIILKLRVLSPQVSDVLDILGEVGVHLQGLDELNLFAEMYSDLSNHFRMQCNRGHTPNEIAELCGATASDAVTLSMLKKKIGRNDPCPCGSGRKYKKCCGR